MRYIVDTGRPTQRFKIFDSLEDIQSWADDVNKKLVYPYKDGWINTKVKAIQELEVGQSTNYGAVLIHCVE